MESINPVTNSETNQIPASFDTGGAAEKKEKPFIAGGLIQAGLTLNREKDYDTLIAETKGEVITKLGLFFINSQVTTGKTYVFSPDIIETPDTSYLDKDGNLRDPKEPFEGLKMAYGYGTQFHIRDVKLTLGGGYSDYTAETPDKHSGLDAKDINIYGYQIKLKAETARLGLGLIHAQQYWNCQMGYNGYAFFYNKDIVNDEVNAYYYFTPQFALKADVARIGTGQKTFFKYSGMPPLFPNKNSDAEQWTIKPGIQLSGVGGLKSIEAGPIIQTGEVIPSLIATPIETGPQSLGVYFELVSRADNKYGFSIARTRASGFDNYFSPGDLYEQTEILELAASAQIKKITVTFGYTHLEKGATFVKQTPVDFLMDKFPRGSQRTTDWTEDAFSLSVAWQLNNHLTVTLKGEYADANYNQYGNVHEIPSKRALGCSVTYRF